MPDIPQIAFVGKPDALSQRITAGGATGTAALSGEGRDLRLMVDGRPQHLAYRSARPLPGGGYEALAEDENVHVETTITPGAGFLSVVSRLTALRPLRLSGFEHAYNAFDLGRRDDPAHLWLPLIPGKAGHALAPDALGTPCIALQSKGRLAALVVDIDALEVDQPLPPLLAYESPSTLRAGYAAGRAAAPGHLERRPAEGMPLPDHDVATLSFLIVLSAEAEPHAGLGRVLRVAWSRFGVSRLDDLSLQTLPLDDYARYAYDAALDRYGLWRDVFLEQGPAGAFAVAAPHRERREGAAPPSPRRPWPTRVRAALARHVPWRERASLLQAGADRARDHLHFGAGANALRTAYGMAHFAERWGDGKLMGAAREIVRLALSAPESKGLFPAVYTGAPDRPAWARGARGNRLDDRYGVADLSESGLWMIRLANDLGLDEAMLDRARRLGDTLMGAQTPEGALPQRLTVSPLGGVHRAGGRRLSGITAIGGAFLAHLGRATGEQRYLEGAGLAAAYVIDHVWPAHAWCGADIHPGASARPPRRNRRTGLALQDTLPMAWAVDLLLAMREAQETGWLDPALAILDELLLYQQIWNAPGDGFDGRGGFGATNTDDRSSEARTALFAPLLLRAYRATGEAEYGLRGAAALRAGFALMRVPENAPIAQEGMEGITEADYGLAPAWRNRPGSTSASSPPLCFDWGSGSASAAAAWVQRHFGDLFVHFGGRSAVGLNGCRVTGATVSPERVDLALARLGPTHPMHRRPLEPGQSGVIVLRAQGVSNPRVRLTVGGVDLGEVDRQALLAGLEIPRAND